MLCLPGCERWCIQGKSKPREMAELGERGKSTLYPEVQRREYWGYHYSKELMEPQIHPHLFLKIVFSKNCEPVESIGRVLMIDWSIQKSQHMKWRTMPNKARIRNPLYLWM